MRNFFTFFLTLFVASSVWAFDFEVDGIYYDIINENEVSVVRGEYTYEDDQGILRGQTPSNTNLAFEIIFGPAHICR